MSIDVDLTTWQWIGLILEYGIKLLAIGIVPEDRKPSSANAWLLLILFLPIVGLPLYLLMSSNFVSRRRHRIQQEANVMVGDAQRDVPDHPVDMDPHPEIESMLRLNRTLTTFPATVGHNQGLWADYEQALQRLVEVVDGARDYVHVEVYIQAWDETTDAFYRALGRATDRGVTVRLLFDNIGSLKYPDSRKLGKRLSDIGV